MIAAEPPQLPPYTQESSLSWQSFNPGDLKQDLITLPLEGALIGAINAFYTPRGDSLWPFNHETANETSHATTFTATKMFPYVLGTTTLILGGLSLTNDNFALGTHIRGWLHSVLLTELATSTAKVTFQRKRPFYDNVSSQNKDPEYDARFSFFSGHASHAFSFATYSSALMFEYSNSQILNWSYATLAYTAASVVSASRVTDNAHNVSDVIAGGLIGTAIAAFVFYRVEQVDKIHKKNNQSNVKMQVVPFAFNDDSNNNWYGANLDITF